MLSCGVLLSTDLNCGVNIKYWGLSRILDCQELLNLSLFVLLHITVEQECCIVLFIIDMRLTSSMRRLLISDQLLQISDQVVQLSYLNVILDHVTWIEETDRFDVLLDGFVILLLLEELIGVLFYDLTLDFSREISLLCDCLSLCIV